MEEQILQYFGLIAVRLGIMLLFFLLLAARMAIQYSTELGMGQVESHGLGTLVIGEFGFLIGVVLIEFGCLAKSKWPTWLVAIPALLVFLSSPLLLQFQQFWISQGWQVGHVLNHFSYATWTLLASIVAIAFSPRV